MGTAAAAMLNERNPIPTSRATMIGSDAISPQTEIGVWARRAATTAVLSNRSTAGAAGS